MTEVPLGSSEAELDAVYAVTTTFRQRPRRVRGLPRDLGDHAGQDPTKWVLR
ncbi:MAG: hypothetical protein ACRELB_00395 [Polyangiaceae bacterium]